MPRLFVPLFAFALLLTACGSSPTRTAQPTPAPEAVAPPAEPAPAPVDNPEPDATLAEFIAWLRSPDVDPDGLVITDVRYWPNDNRNLTIDLEVSNQWHSLEKTPRLDTAKALWEKWAVTADPENYDYARIRLVSAGGTQVGGSRAISGGVIWVED